MTTATPTIERVEQSETAESTQTDRPWVTVVWNDPVNLMSYVTWVFQKILGHSKAKANRLMMQVHTEGKAAVSSGSREQMERDVSRLQASGLWATLQRD
jgi:ATP-dependent Clp protease adaptor protein ClpS